MGYHDAIDVSTTFLENSANVARKMGLPIAAVPPPHGQTECVKARRYNGVLPTLGFGKAVHVVGRGKSAKRGCLWSQFLL